jgi:hypothetical protein
MEAQRWFSVQSALHKIKGICCKPLGSHYTGSWVDFNFRGGNSGEERVFARVMI